jgi:hypothetical protein
VPDPDRDTRACLDAETASDPESPAEGRAVRFVSSGQAWGYVRDWPPIWHPSLEGVTVSD